MKRALIVVDVQNDFCEGGTWRSRAAPRSRPTSASCCTTGRRGPQGADYDGRRRDPRPPRRPGRPLQPRARLRDSWPPHCVVGTDGEAFHPNLDPQPFDAIFLKGEHAAAYSGFEGAHPTAPRWPTGCAGTRSRRGRVRARRPTTACGPPPWTRPARGSRPACCSAPAAPGSPPRPREADPRCTGDPRDGRALAGDADRLSCHRDRRAAGDQLPVDGGELARVDGAVGGDPVDEQLPDLVLAVVDDRRGR